MSDTLLRFRRFLHGRKLQAAHITSVLLLAGLLACGCSSGGKDWKKDSAPDPLADTAGPVDPILAALAGGDPLSLGLLEAATGLSTAELLAALTRHEIAGRITRLPGGAFRTPPTAVVR